jgi:hypothetical protein
MPRINEITKALSRGTLEEARQVHFGGDTVKAKFVRIGSLILFAPLVACDPIPGQRDSSEPEHISIIMGGFQSADPTLVQRVRESSDAEYDNPTALHLNNDGLVDAGGLTYSPDLGLVITGESVRFGRADEVGRNLTIALAQAAIEQS